MTHKHTGCCNNMFFSSHDEFGGSNVAGGGLVAMVVVQRVALGEGRALWGAVGERSSSNNHGPLWAFKMVVLCVFSYILCCFLLLYGVYSSCIPY